MKNLRTGDVVELALVEFVRKQKACYYSKFPAEVKITAQGVYYDFTLSNHPDVVMIGGRVGIFHSSLYQVSDPIRMDRDTVRVFCEATDNGLKLAMESLKDKAREKIDFLNYWKFMWLDLMKSELKERN